MGREEGIAGGPVLRKVVLGVSVAPTANALMILRAWSPPLFCGGMR